MAQPSGNGATGQRPSPVDSAERARRNCLAPGRHRVGDRLPPEQEVAAMLGISRGTLRTALQRLEDTGEIIRRQGSPTFVGRVAVPTQLDERLERMLTEGKMLLDVMIELELPIGFARTRVIPRLVTPREQAGKALRMKCTTAALELEEVVCLGGGSPVAHSRDLFAPGALDVGVMRSLDAERPTPIMSRNGSRRRARNRSPRVAH